MDALKLVVDDTVVCNGVVVRKIEIDTVYVFTDNTIYNCIII
ncbi:Uncharacterised protein [uncultured archaeon]|nr:Uncharacterised protein [uncultured archaeon]